MKNMCKQVLLKCNKAVLKEKIQNSLFWVLFLNVISATCIAVLDVFETHWAVSQRQISEPEITNKAKRTTYKCNTSCINTLHEAFM